MRDSQDGDLDLLISGQQNSEEYESTRPFSASVSGELGELDGHIYTTMHKIDC